MKSLVSLWKVAATDLAARCGTSIERDVLTVIARCENEGESFLTLTLPAFGKLFEQSLEVGQVLDEFRHSFKCDKAGLPLFLGGFLRAIFNSNGAVREDVDSDYVQAVRQLTLMFGKLKRDCSPKRVRSAFQSYVDVDVEVAEHIGKTTQEQFDKLSRASVLLFGRVLSTLEEDLYYGRLLPKHGPGVTADRLFGNEKYSMAYWPERLEGVFPFLEYALPSPSYWNEVLSVNFASPESEIPVKVIGVPKTLKTPRIIAVEPTCMQYMQQALHTRLVQLLEEESVKGSLLPGVRCWNFTEQEPNRESARLASATRQYATLDLKDASDRVSTWHVDALLRYHPLLQEGVYACRSTHAKVPGHGVIRLAKFASMGSALTFPLEAMVFSSIAFIAFCEARQLPLTARSVMLFHREVRVYGDDIIVPDDTVHLTVGYLELFGLKVNASKSFFRGFFRESCGGDYYNGNDVSVVRLRKDIPSSKHFVEEVVSLVEFRNQLYRAGMWVTASYCDDTIEQVLKFFPVIHATSPLLGRLTYLPYQVDKTDRALHRPLAKGYVVKAKPPPNEIDGWPALQKIFLYQGLEPLDKEHLIRSGRPQAVNIKLGYGTPY